ncbi:MAG: hypothetical protein FWE34_00670 [Defluviitaleaceae bacterium]|nr:hypothetical protein [Defluviitaleaceae bacterium]
MLKQNRAARLFVKTVLISVNVMLIIGGGVWLAVDNAVRSPEMPPIMAANISSRDNGDDSELSGGEYAELLPPRLIQFEERKLPLSMPKRAKVT